MESSHFSVQTRRESSFPAVRTFPSCAGASGAAPRGGNSPLVVMQRSFLIKQPFPIKLVTASRCPSVLATPFPTGTAPKRDKQRAPGTSPAPRRRERAERAALRQRQRFPRGVCGAEQRGGQPRNEGSRRPSRPPGAGESQARPSEREPETGRKEQGSPGESDRERRAGSPGGLTFSRRSRSRSSSRWRTWARSSASSACCCRHWIFLFTASRELGAAMGAALAAGRARRCCTWRRAAPRLSMGR